jgi:hypothetical protein
MVQRHDRGEEPRDPASLEEQLRVCGAHEEHVVVEIDVPLCEPVDVVQLRFDRVGVEDGQHVWVGEDVSVIDHGDPRVVRVQPVGDLSRCDEEDPTEP